MSTISGAVPNGLSSTRKPAMRDNRSLRPVASNWRAAASASVFVFVVSRLLAVCGKGLGAVFLVVTANIVVLQRLAWKPVARRR